MSFHLEPFQESPKKANSAHLLHNSEIPTFRDQMGWVINQERNSDWFDTYSGNIGHRLLP